jgi:hypothetical protein
MFGLKKYGRTLSSPQGVRNFRERFRTLRKEERRDLYRSSGTVRNVSRILYMFRKRETRNAHQRANIFESGSFEDPERSEG